MGMQMVTFHRRDSICKIADYFILRIYVVKLVSLKYVNHSEKVELKILLEYTVFSTTKYISGLLNPKVLISVTVR